VGLQIRPFFILHNRKNCHSEERLAQREALRRDEESAVALCETQKALNSPERLSLPGGRLSANSHRISITTC
jgi:hypothetical protein